MPEVKVRRIKDILFVLAVLGAVAGLIRLATGLGATTSLSDEIPWGLWKVLNMVAGVALATGGFILAFCVHVLHIRSLRPILRPALLVAFLGYGASCAALMLDIGLPHRCWHPIFYWNVHSFLFEVFWCVMLYFTVTALEVAPIALEDSRFGKLYRLIRKIAAPVVILGITFSTLHHTSLGSLFLVSATRIHDLWYTPWLPAFFILSAAGAGMMSVVLLTLISCRLYGKEAPMPALTKVAGASAIVLGIYLVGKVIDLGARGSLSLVFSGQWEGWLFLLEMLCAAVIPVALLAVPRVRRSAGGLATAGVLAVIGLALNRVDVGIFAYFRTGGTTYVPTLAELAVTIGIPAAGGLAFLLFIERFKVFDREGGLADEVDPRAAISFQSQTGVWNGVFLNAPARMSLIAVVTVPVALALFLPIASADADVVSPVDAPMGADATRAMLQLDGNRNGQFVLFPHDAHKQRQGGDESCVKCHHLDRPGDSWTSCHHCHADMERTRSIFDHDLHVTRIARDEGYTGPLAGNRACAKCHDGNGPSNRENARACLDCHEDDMRMSPTEGHRQDMAIGYVDALHKSCVGCHEEMGASVGRPLLGDCDTCHK
jgi:Ni/Fe-hydrogenase subunit HybB-like protein